MQKRKSKKGFTMMELLATITILGILMVIAIPTFTNMLDKSKNESKRSLGKTIVMATESYLQSNKGKSPKAIGDTKLISAQELKKHNYLKEELKNADGKSCMKDSLVRVYKNDINSYRYVPYIFCEGDKVPDKIEGTKPKIDIVFTDTYGNDYEIAKENVTAAALNIRFNGGEDVMGENVNLSGYSYIIMAKLNETDEFVELFNSGSINARGRHKVKIEKNLIEYMDITKISYINIIAEAYNEDGGHLRVEKSSKYHDTKGPGCGTVTGEPKENEWNKAWREKTITVKCEDKTGSGCVKDTYTKTFKKEAEFGYITIKDNTGNTTDCKVRINLDWTEPEVELKAYALKADGKKGKEVGSVKANSKNKNASLNKYTDGKGEDSWLNKEKFPYGIYYELKTTDNVKLSTGTWSENNANLLKSDANVFVLNSKITKSLTSADSSLKVSIEEDGYRKGIFEVSDKADNKVTIDVTAPLDRVEPTCVSSGGSDWTKSAVTLTGTCSDTMSGCKEKTITKKYTNDINSTTETPGTVVDNAENKTVCPKDRMVRIDNTAPTDITISGNPGCVITPQQIVLTLKAKEKGVGVSHWQYGYSLNEMHDYANSASETFKTTPFSAVRNQPAYLRVCDKLGNCNYKSTNICIKKKTPTIGGYAGKWVCLYRPRNACDPWAAQLGCSSGVYCNAIGKVNISCVDSNCKINWEVNNGGETWIANGYYSNLHIYKNGSLYATYNIKDAWGPQWGKGSHQTGSVNVNLGSGFYEIKMESNTYAPSYTGVLGTISVP